MASSPVTSQIKNLAEKLQKLSLQFENKEVPIEQLLNCSRELHELIINCHYEMQKESLPDRHANPIESKTIEEVNQTTKPSHDEPLAAESKTMPNEEPMANKEEQSTINAKLGSDAPSNLEGTLNKKPIANLRTDIGINERFFLIKELFGGSAEEFNSTLDLLEGCTSRTEAIDCFNNNLAQKYGWEDESEALDVFLNLISRRYLV